ncbi:hypothetical protein KC19_1G245700 [Ceratodon purpureus]|uniref:Uncharacterized protein n=1 Tax=Ceratodon purpureus TaxID=3225 RepID=A0A8T0JBI8_CERPU|nr:hypothetical protein KC19_1G245700 [Ceratodon purpureus]
MAHTLNFVAGFVTLLVILAATLSCEARRMQETTKVASQAVADVVRHGTEGNLILELCSGDSISINQKLTPSPPGTPPGFAVEIYNLCTCPVSNLVLDCPHFATATPIDPNTMRIQKDGTCLVKNGQAIAAHGMVAFAYHQSFRETLSFHSATFGC